MRYTCTLLVILGLLTAAQAAWADPMSSTDLWDVSQGATVTGTSGALYYSSSYRSDPRDMFGGAFGTIEAGNTLFKDYISPGYQGGSVPAGYAHWVEWMTPASVTVRSFNLHAHNEGMTRRAFNRFVLYSSSSSGGPWTVMYDTGPGYTYDGFTHIAANVAGGGVAAQYYRAVFVQAPWSSGNAVGPRIQELDGFSTLIGGDPVPEPTTLALLGAGLLGSAALRRRRRRA